MADVDCTPIFGSLETNVDYIQRRAAYVVIVSNEGTVAMVKAVQIHNGNANAFLPGGGSRPDEAPEDTVIREVMEELARSLRLIKKIGEAIQYFYSNDDDRHYQMLATFFVGEFVEAPYAAADAGTGGGEHELFWLSVTDAEQACFHACHAWAIRRQAEQ